MSEHRIQTSRGEIIITDTHVFDIKVPVDDSLTISFHGENTAFRIEAMLQESKETTFDGKKIVFDKN
jgi:hypothetical protein